MSQTPRFNKRWFPLQYDQIQRQSNPVAMRQRGKDTGPTSPATNLIMLALREAATRIPIFKSSVWPGWESNPQPPSYKANALTTKPQWQVNTTVEENSETNLQDFQVKHTWNIFWSYWDGATLTIECVLPHWEIECSTTQIFHPVTVYWHQADQSWD